MVASIVLVFDEGDPVAASWLAPAVPYTTSRALLGKKKSRLEGLDRLQAGAVPAPVSLRHEEGGAACFSRRALGRPGDPIRCPESPKQFSAGPLLYRSSPNCGSNHTLRWPSGGLLVRESHLV